ncbi:MAG: cation:proton antiporter domain-containing protein [Rhodospirillaceae bacterium]
MASQIDIGAYSDALVVLGTAGVIVPLFRKLGISPVLAYLASGAVLGPLGLGSLMSSYPGLYWFTVVDAHNLEGVAELGIVFLFFLIGIELSFQRLMAMRRLVLGLGTLQVLLTTALITGVALMAGQSSSVALVIGMTLSLSSTAIVLELLSNQGRLATTTGRASFSVLLAQDIAVIPVLMFISIMGANAGGSVLQSLATALLQAGAALIIIVVLGRILLRPLFRLVAGTKSSELFIAAVLFVIVGAGVLAHQAGLSMALGAFVAGLLLAETEYDKAIETTVAPFKGLLLGLFFFTVGMNIDLRAILREPLWIAAGVAGLIGLKAVLLIAAGKVFRLPWPAAIETGLLLGPGGEFAFVGVGLAASLGLVEPDVTGFVLAVVALTMALTPLLAIAGQRLGAKLAAPIAADPELAVQPVHLEHHAIVVGYGRVGKVVCALLKEHGVAYIAIDSHASSVSRERKEGEEVYFGDACDPAFLNTCGLAAAKGVIITIDAIEAIDTVVGNVRAARPDILIVSRARDAGHARHLYGIGASDAVPETVEASLQLSEAALVGLGIATGPAIASIHEKRDEFRKTMQTAAKAVGRDGAHTLRSKRKAP